MRRVADAVGTTTRAVYTVFGSKDGLLVALGGHAFELLGAAVEELPVTDDPVVDLVEAGAVAFRDFVIGHPALFRVGVQRIAVPDDVAAGFSAPASAALRGLQERLDRLASREGLGGRSLADATWEFHALCEGLGALELRLPMPQTRAPKLWRDALGSLVTGWRRSSP